MVLGTERGSRKALRRRIRPIEMVIAVRPEKIMGHEDLRWRWFERSEVARSKGSKCDQFRAGFSSGLGLAYRVVGLTATTVATIDRRASFWPYCVVGLTATTVATDRKRLRSSACFRVALSRPALRFFLPYAKNASHTLAAAPATTQ